MGIKNRLTELMNEKNINTNELALKVNVTPSTLYSILQRDSTRIDIDLIMKLSHALGITADELLSDEIDRMKPAAFSEPLDPNEAALLNAYRSFNKTGRAKLMDYVADLESSPRNFGELSDSYTDLTEKDNLA